MDEKLKEKIIKEYFRSLKFGYSFKDTHESHLIYVEIGRILSHLFWTLVALFQLKDNSVGFSMVYYIQRRC
jgi:hypothetical protein